MVALAPAARWPPRRRRVSNTRNRSSAHCRTVRTATISRIRHSTPPWGPSSSWRKRNHDRATAATARFARTTLLARLLSGTLGVAGAAGTARQPVGQPARDYPGARLARRGAGGGAAPRRVGKRAGRQARRSRALGGAVDRAGAGR